MSGANLGSPYSGYASPQREPHPEEFGGGVLRRHALAAGVRGEHLPYPVILATRSYGRFADYQLAVLDELVGRVHGEPRSARRTITGRELASRAPRIVGEDPSPADWTTAAELLMARVATEQGITVSAPAAPEPVAPDPGEPLTTDATPKPSWLRRRPTPP